MAFFSFQLVEPFWNKTKSIKQIAIIIGVLSFSVYLYLVYQEPRIPFLYELASIAKGLNAGCWIIVVFGYAKKYLSQSGKWRTYFIQAYTFFATFILTILLSPEVFGIYLVAIAFINILVYVSDVGLAAALIQIKKEPPKAD